MNERLWISWMPSWMNTAELAHFEIEGGAAQHAPWSCVRPHPEDWPALCEGLRKAQSALRAMPIARIVAAIDTVSQRWLERGYEPRQRARDAVAAATGFSPEAVERSFDMELRNYGADSLLRALRRDLGHETALDEFRPDRELGGRALAIGPRITLAILSGNVPGLPALSLVRALLAKSAVIAKVASGEPTFAAGFVRTLFEVEPALADAIAVTYWDRADLASLRAALAQVDAVIAYGSEPACAAIRAELAPHQRYVEHGHKLSLGIVSRGYLQQLGGTEVARRIAEDACAFNQHACIAPVAYLIEAEPAGLRAFAAYVAQALDRYAERCPLGQLDEREAAALQMQRASAAWEAAQTAEHELWQAAGLDWTLVLATDLAGLPAAGNRLLRMVPVASLDQALERLRPLARYLQNVGLGVLGPELWPLAQELARLGVARVCEPGRMAEPSLMWRHDGEPCISRLVRWCDVEMHREVESASRAARSA